MSSVTCNKRPVLKLQIQNKKHLKNVGPIRHCEPPHALILHCYSSGVATVARRLRIDVHNNDDNDNNENAWQRGPLWPHGMRPMIKWPFSRFSRISYPPVLFLHLFHMRGCWDNWHRIFFGIPTAKKYYWKPPAHHLNVLLSNIYSYLIFCAFNINNFTK